MAAVWPNRDPLRNAEQSQGPSLYAFAKNGPTIYIDPNGRAAIAVPIGEWIAACLGNPACIAAIRQAALEAAAATAAVGTWIVAMCKPKDDASSETCELTKAEEVPGYDFGESGTFLDGYSHPPTKQCTYRCKKTGRLVRQTYPSGTTCEESITVPIE